MHYLTLILYLFFPSISEADDIWKKYDIPDTINCITTQGEYIWLGTDNGLLRLNRFDGTEKTYTIKEGLPSNIVTSICLGDNNSIYFGLQDSSYIETLGKFYKKAYIYCLKDGLLTDYSEFSGLRNTHYFNEYEYLVTEEISLIKNDKNIIYFCNNVRITPGSNDKYFEVYVYKYSNAWSTIYSKTLIWGVNQNLSELNIYNIIVNPLTIITDTNNNPLKDIFYDKNGSWYIYYNSYYCLNIEGSTNIKYNSENSSLNGIINVMLVDRNDIKWFGCTNGSNILVKYNGESWSSFQANDWRSFNTSIKMMIADDDNCIWVVTSRPTGLYRFNPNAVTSVESAKQTPATFTLSTAYPNPFNASTTIRFTLNKPEKVNIAIYNLAGQKVRELAAGNYSAGSHTAVWDGRDVSGNAVSSGVYLARMESGGVSKVVRMAMVK